MTTPVAAPSAAPAASSAPSTPSTSSTPTASSTPSQPATPSTGGSPAAAPTSGHAPSAQSQSATPAGQSGNAAAQAAEAARKLKLKVNGRELEMDEAEVIRKAQLASSADQKFQEAAQIRKQAEQFLNQLISDPMSVLTHPELADKIQFRQLAEQYLAKELQRELMSPEQRELAELREWRQQQEAAKQADEQQKLTKTQQEERTKLQQRAAQDYDVKLTEVLQKADLPKTPFTVKRVAELLYNAVQKGYDLDMQTAVDMVRENYVSDLGALAGGLDGEALIKTFGQDLLKKIRKYDLAQLKARLNPAEQQQATAATTSSAPKDDGQRKLSPDEWREMIRKRAGL